MKTKNVTHDLIKGGAVLCSWNANVGFLNRKFNKISCSECGEVLGTYEDDGTMHFKSSVKPIGMRPGGHW